MNVKIGIDLGTGFCQCSYISDDGRPVVGSFKSGDSIPSVVYFNEGIPVVGQEAADLATLSPQNAVFNSKRYLGTDKVLCENNGTSVTAEDTTKFLLEAVKSEAEQALGAIIDTCVISVPANFTDEQKEAVIRAAKAAGFTWASFPDQSPRLINEPTAALRCADADKVVLSDGVVVVLDVGHGTTDITVARRQSNKYDIIATNGIPELGGMDITDILLDYCRAEFQQRTGIEINQDTYPDEFLELRNRCESGKIRLGKVDEVQIPIKVDSEKQLITITKEQSIQLTKPQVDSIIETLSQTVTEAGLTVDDINQLILVGGGSLFHAIDPACENYLGRPLTDIGNRLTAVCRGAALEAWAECGEVTTSTGYKLPAQVAIVREVTSHAYGIQALDDDHKPRFATLLKKGAPIPSTFTRQFVLADEGSTGAEVIILQGGTEGGSPDDATSLGSFRLENLTPVYGRSHRVEVTCILDKNGLLKSTAYDTEQGITASEEVSV